jgi:hypothetical protein
MQTKWHPSTDAKPVLGIVEKLLIHECLHTSPFTWATVSPIP